MKAWIWSTFTVVPTRENSALSGIQGCVLLKLAYAEQWNDDVSSTFTIIFLLNLLSEEVLPQFSLYFILKMTTRVLIFCILLFSVCSCGQWNWNCVVWIFLWNWGAECVWNGQFPKCQAIIRINLFSCLPLRQKKNYKFKRHPCYYWGKEHTKITQKIEIFSRGIGFYGNPKLHLWAREKQQQFRWQHIYNIKLVVVVKQILVRIRPT